MSNYNILWIDDEWETRGKGTINDARAFGIDLIPFKSYEGGIAALKSNYLAYDGVLLDARIMKEETDQPGAEHNKWSHRAKDAILQLPKPFEIFVLSAATSTLRSSEYENAFPNLYQKANDEDLDRLWMDLKKAADRREDTHIRRQHPGIFDLCTDDYLGSFMHESMLNLVKAEQDGSLNEDHLNVIRKVMERMMGHLQKLDLLPEELHKLNQHSLYFNGVSTRFKHKGKAEQSIRMLKHSSNPPDFAQKLIRSVVEVTQVCSHPLALETYLKQCRSPYLPKATLNQLFTLMEWLKSWIDSKPATHNWT